MVLWECVLAASAPGLFWLWVFWRRDKWQPEPKAKVLKLFGLGALFAAPVWLVESWLPGPRNAYYDVFVRIALTEEVFKLLPVVLFAVRSREFSEPMDGLVYAIAAGLGFATVENALYAASLGPALLVQRAFTSTLAHAAFSGLLGYGLAKTKFGGGPRPVAAAFLGVVGLHGAYDLALQLGADPAAPEIYSRVVIGTAVPALLLALYGALNRASAESPYRRRRATPTRPGRESSQAAGSTASDTSSIRKATVSRDVPTEPASRR